MIRSSQGFESEFPVITSYPNLGYQSGAWFVLDDLLLVNFNPDSLNKNRFSEFKQDYGLEQLNFPDSVFPEGIFTYIFQFNVNDVKPGSAIDLSKSIYLQDSGLVINVQPNLINAYEKIPPENSFSTNKELPENDVEYYLVHTQNKSVLLFVRLKGEAPLAMIRVYDLFGREVYSFQAVEEYFNLEIDISDYAGGIYFACIENERGEVMGMQKFVKL
ncbi:MAG TPA: T9SS type A sorting domain-containing protein, partial [Chitinophagales bacterium]|nr:T9SS type A sorting domain-containing protein [Chitinophagales bacterium]